VPCILQAASSPTRQLANLATLPTLNFTGEASHHPYDYCTVAFLKQAGCDRADHLELGKAGIHGNSHIMFMEKICIENWKRTHQRIGMSSRSCSEVDLAFGNDMYHTGVMASRICKEDSSVADA
jgi:hypothetical protein